MPKRSEPIVPTLPLDTTTTASDSPVEGDAVARFEQDLRELEDIVGQMEKGELRLEDSIRLFERGSLLAKSCRKSLDTAELRVRNLLDEREPE